jgi:hypothetical protein
MGFLPYQLKAAPARPGGAAKGAEGLSQTLFAHRLTV